MNRIFAITGFLAAGMADFWVHLFIIMPWICSSGSPKASASVWFMWLGISAIGAGIIYAFIRYAFSAHWAALFRNAPMPRGAWRGVGVVYLFLTVSLAIGVLMGGPSGSHRNERYLYTGLTAFCLMLTAVAFRQGFRRHT